MRITDDALRQCLAGMDDDLRELQAGQEATRRELAKWRRWMTQHHPLELQMLDDEDALNEDLRAEAAAQAMEETIYRLFPPEVVH